MQKAYNYDTKIGMITIIQEGSYIIEISFGENIDGRIIEETNLIKKTYDQIIEYLDGKRRNFNIPIALQGTDFQKSVWEELRKIPYGQTCTYLDIANRIGNPRAARAVGMANHNNPIAIIIPCHRVIGKNGTLVGYAGGVRIKEQLLEIENAKR